VSKETSSQKQVAPTVADSGFGLIDYVNMLKCDFRAPFIYFFERHIFDIVNNTDTHKRLLVEDYEEGIQDVRHSFNHSCSWTSVITSSLRFVTKYLGKESSRFSFFDVGCGKGKVLLVATKEGFLDQFSSSYGVEINQDLVDIAYSNFQTMDLPSCQILTESAKTLDLAEINKKMVIYLYNPFDESLLEDFLRSQTFDRCIIIYNNPQFSEVILQAGFKEIMKKDHVMTNGRITIFESV